MDQEKLPKSIKNLSLEERIKYQSTLFEYISDAVILTDLEFNIVSWNKAAESIYGWKAEEAIGKNIREIIPVTYLNDEESDVINQLLKDGIWKGEVIQEKKDGNKISILSSVSLIKDKDGNSLGAVAINRDITEFKKKELHLKKSEEKFRELSNQYEMLLNSITDSVYAFNRDWEYILVNKSAEMIDNLSAEDVIGRKITDIFPGIKKTPFFKVYEQVMNTGEMQRIINSFFHLNGHEGYYEVSVYPINEGILCIVKDVTEEKKAEIKLKESKEQYQEAYNLANFYKDLFAHDINNILQSIISSMDYYSLFKDNPEKMKNLGDIDKIIKNHAKRGAALVSDVRKLSQLDETEIILKPVNISNILTKSIDFAITSFQDKNVKIDLKGISKDMKVFGNELLKDIFDNILNNAIKYTEFKEDVKIDINISKIQENNIQFIKFEFIDNGIGVPDMNKQNIFKRMSIKLKNKRGMGIGLSLVAKIVDKYEGKVWVEDRIKGDHQKGSNFILLLKEA